MGLGAGQVDVPADRFGLLPGPVLQLQPVAEAIQFARGERPRHRVPGEKTGEGREQTAAEGRADGKG